MIFFSTNLYGRISRRVAALGMPSRRLDDLIRNLCATAVSTPESELESVLEQLRIAVRDRVEKEHERVIRKLRGQSVPSSRKEDVEAA